MIPAALGLKIATHALAGVAGAVAAATLVLFAPPIRVLGFGFDGGALARLGDARSEIERLETNFAFQKAATAVSEGLREAEQDQASEDAADADRACNARVEAARRSSAAISTIITTEPTYDATGCPVRELVPADRLRGIFEPADPDGDAGGVSSEPAG